jgi:hypothetical protein
LLINRLTQITIELRRGGTWQSSESDNFYFLK